MGTKIMVCGNDEVLNRSRLGKIFGEQTKIVQLAVVKGDHVLGDDAPHYAEYKPGASKDDWYSIYELPDMPFNNPDWEQQSAAFSREFRSELQPS